jgi:hypothetical protein
MTLKTCLRIKVYQVIIIHFVLFISTPSLAGDIQSFKSLFQRHFWGSFYQEKKCGPNSTLLIRHAIKERISLAGALIVHIENNGNSNFGLIGALKAREQGRYINSTDDSLSPVNGNNPQHEMGDANWYYHAFVMIDGFVFDLDYTNSATMTHFSDYIISMFIPDSKINDNEYIEYKLGGYSLSFYEVLPLDSEYAFSANNKDFLKETKSSNLLQYLKDKK